MELDGKLFIPGLYFKFFEIRVCIVKNFFSISSRRLIHSRESQRIRSSEHVRICWSKQVMPSMIQNRRWKSPLISSEVFTERFLIFDTRTRNVFFSASESWGVVDNNEITLRISHENSPCQSSWISAKRSRDVYD